MAVVGAGAVFTVCPGVWRVRRGLLFRRLADRGRDEEPDRIGEAARRFYPADSPTPAYSCAAPFIAAYLRRLAQYVT